ncbi:MAG: magnesium transporter [Candidatus Bathyarchaeia archaeon]
MGLADSRSFSKTLKQSLAAYAFNICGIVAGSIIAYYSGLFNMAPWAVVVYPPILSARGVIGGLFCGRISTGLHLGTIQPRFFGNTKGFYLLFKAIVVMTCEASLMMSFISIIFRSTYSTITVNEFLNIIGMVMATMALALVVISPLTMVVSFQSFKHRLDPDVVLYPIESTVSDVLITSLYIAVLNLSLFHNFLGQLLVVLAASALLAATIFTLFKTVQEPEFIKTLKESIPTLVFVSFIINVAGATLGRVDEVLRSKQEVYRSYPVYVVYPALIDTIGDVGAVIGSTATTKLALGTLKPSFSSIKNHAAEILGAWAASLIMYMVYSILALTTQGLISPLNLLKFTLLLITANAIAAFFIIIVSYSVAILTYQKGLDPDNFEIPIESSMADSITTISLLTAMTLLVGG